MKKILEQISEVVSAAFETAGYDKSYGKVTLSNRPDLCEYQCNGAMAAAKAYKKAPFAIAEEVVANLAGSEMLAEAVCVMPGFINMRISPEFLAGYLNQMASLEKFGYNLPENPLSIVVDYGGANVAKPLHVGHLRPAIIGESVKRICRYVGHNVIGDAHLGDWGLQMGQVIEETKDRQPDLPYFDPDFKGEYPTEAPFSIEELAEIYPTASAKCKVDEEFKQRAQDATFKFQSGDPGYTALCRHITNVSKQDLKKNYDNLLVFFDLWKGESDAQPYIDDMIDDMVKKGVAYESQGALVVDIAMEGDKKEYPPCIVRKSNGAAIYQTTDLATIVERKKLYDPDQIIYVVDKRQDLHFIQVFRTARKAGLVSDECKLDFLGFGTMNGKDGKPFKTRDGGVLKLETLINDINQAVYERIIENREISEEEARETAKIIGLAALKYGDLSNQASKDYVFDVDRFISFEGNTGPYLLYTIVRIKSILNKYRDNGGDVNAAAKILAAGSDSEKALMLQITKLNEMLENAYAEIAPHKICQYCYELSDAFNKFYHDTKILAEENEERKASFIALIKLTRDIMLTCIDLLGFEAPERM